MTGTLELEWFREFGLENIAEIPHDELVWFLRNVVLIHIVARIRAMGNCGPLPPQSADVVFDELARKILEQAAAPGQ